MLDTSREAAQVQEEVQRKLHPSERVRIAMEMSLTARALKRARLRQEHPDWDEARAHAELLRDLLPAGHPAAP